VNTSQANSNVRKTPADEHTAGLKLAEVLLSVVPPCEVTLVSDPSQQSQPSKTRAELLADGQCEV